MAPQRCTNPARRPARLGSHWDIEAVHHVRATMREDAQRLRAASSAQVMAAIRNTAIAVLRLSGFTSTAPGRRWAARNPARPVVALGLTIRE